MLARTPFTEIEIEDVGLYRLPTMWQRHRIKRVKRSGRDVAALAFGCGTTVRQFRKLPADKHAQVRSLAGPDLPEKPIAASAGTGGTREAVLQTRAAEAPT